MGSRTDVVKPLTALLSQAFVAFAIECDNAFEERVPHRTTLEGDTADEHLPWLTSIGMWALYLRHIDDDGTTTREFARRAGLSKEAVRNVLVRAIRWWGYLDIVPPRDEPSSEKASWVLRASMGGRAALSAWRTLAEEIECRWKGRFGSSEITALRAALERAGDRLRAFAPYLPVGGYGMRVGADRSAPFDTPSPLYALLARLLVAAAESVENDLTLSMAIGDNVVRAIAREELPIRDLLAETGVSQRAIASSITFLAAKKLIAQTRRGRSPAIALNDSGVEAWSAFERRRDAVENDWRERVGVSEIAKLRGLLEYIIDSCDGVVSLLGTGLIPPSNGWRAASEYRRQTEAFVTNPGRNLPQFPVIAHRGAWPDGS
ncbi:MAG TPA: hypothetical protein VGK84_08375 [Candidatus Tumulicola sp.]|jgi:hypothetical protein